MKYQYIFVKRISTMKCKLFFLVSIALTLFFSSAYIYCPAAKTLKKETAAPNSSSETRGVQVKDKSAASFGSLYNKSYAVVIGINNYEKWPSLEYAVNDAKAMEKKLKSLGFETTTLLNQNAGKDNILKILGDELPRKVGKNDRVIIFFAGHGQTEQLADESQMGYIIPVDADTGNIFSTAISMDQVRVFSRRLKAKHVLYLIDSCYAGLGLTRAGSIPASEKDYLRKITTRKAHQMLVAGGKGELAHEEGSHGVFTKYVLEALDGAADRDEKGYITFSDISSYVKPKVSRQTHNSQVPQYGNIDGEGEFVFISTATPATAPNVNSQPPTQTNDALLKIEQEKQRLEQEKADLAAQREQLEEQKRLNEERQKLESERQALENQRNKLAEDRKKVGSYRPAPTNDLRRRRTATLAAENLEGIVIRIVYVARRKHDADQAAQKLNQLGAKVDLYKTDDSGNAAFVGKIFVKNGYENYSALITKTVQNIEDLAADSSYQNSFNDGQHFNLWLAK
jgi:hypothetical protein